MSEVEAADIELALQFKVDDITSNIMMCDGWSMLSLGAELCFHLARRLAPGNAERKRLIDRGITQSTIAGDQVTTSNGMIKHILAYEANNEIQKWLLELASADVDVSRAIIYDLNGYSESSFGSSDDKKSHISLANRFVVKDDTSKNDSSNGSSMPKNHTSAPKKKVAFAPIHVSSLESHGDSHNSQDHQ